jgi:DNA-binding NarL/FixJ family response regulator
LASSPDGHCDVGALGWTGFSDNTNGSGLPTIPAWRNTSSQQGNCLSALKPTYFSAIAAVEASLGRTGYPLADELQPDLILLDIGLPRLNGIAAAREIGKLSPKSKILFLSQDTDAEIVKAALRAGGNGYVVKWDAGDQLFEAMETVIQGGQCVFRVLRLEPSEQRNQSEHLA